MSDDDGGEGTTASGFKYPIPRGAKEHEEAFERRRDAVLALRERLRRKLEAGKKQSISLRQDQVAQIVEWLDHAERWERDARELVDLRARDWALHQLYYDMGSDTGPRAVTRALGFTSGKRGRHYPMESIVSDYVWLIGKQPTYGMIHMTIGQRPDGTSIYPKRPLALADAVRAVGRYKFPSATACRTFLVRARDEIKVANGGKPRWGALCHEFRIPSESQL